MVFEDFEQHWNEKLLRQAPPYKEVKGAFGDFFLASFLPGTTPAEWRAVVVHGTPWCTSRFSAFEIDVLVPTADALQPRVVWHTERGYSRGDFEPSLKTSGNVFEFRINADAMEFDTDRAFERRVVYRYRVNANAVDRIEPIAINARGFLEEWLDMPWNEAAAQTYDPADVKLKMVHASYQRGSKEVNSPFTNLSYGPVLACKQSKQFQVEFRASREAFIPNKPGGASTPLPSTYFSVRETGNGYELLSATNKPDPQCGGPDLIPTKR
jgi:hypothetical protein